MKKHKLLQATGKSSEEAQATGKASEETQATGKASEETQATGKASEETQATGKASEETQATGKASEEASEEAQGVGKTTEEISITQASEDGDERYKVFLSFTSSHALFVEKLVKDVTLQDVKNPVVAGYVLEGMFFFIPKHG